MQGWETGDTKMRRSEEQDQEGKKLFGELTQYEKNGCRFYLNGRPARPGKIVSACLRENATYMREFVSDEKDHIRGINFIRIKEK